MKNAPSPFRTGRFKRFQPQKLRSDFGIFSPVLYQLSYLSACAVARNKVKIIGKQTKPYNRRIAGLGAADFADADEKRQPLARTQQNAQTQQGQHAQGDQTECPVSVEGPTDGQNEHANWLRVAFGQK